jgi:ribose transport system ATP-binding protein
MRAGRLTRIFQRDGWSQDALLAAAFGDSAPPAPTTSTETADAL